MIIALYAFAELFLAPTKTATELVAVFVSFNSINLKVTKDTADHISHKRPCQGAA